MAARPILIDTTRLLTRLRHAAPSGIDRVDLAYARRFLGGQPDRRGVAITARGPRLVPADRIRQLMALIGGRWREEIAAADDPVLDRIRARLGGGARPPAAPARRRALPRIDPAETLFRIAALSWPEAATAPRDAVYLHTSHIRLDRPERFAWLNDRRDVKPVFFVHDLIPIEFPEYGVPGEAARHRTRMQTVARHAAAVLANSDDVARRFTAHCEAEGWRRPAVAVAPLGVEEAFTRDPPAFRGGRPYFVVCSTIEARKNHLLLLQVWRDLAGALGPDCPALVIVGRRGWEAEAAIDLLDRCPAIAPHVIEAPGLSTPALAELVRGARGLLMPSFAEGYGIPVVEALSLGTPVIASDIPVHREIAGGRATFVHPLDGPGWQAAIVGAAREPGPGYRPPTWAAHFRVVDEVLASL
jgi:glycosyltransferase involved in cell wall biosynthesis